MDGGVRGGVRGCYQSVEGKSPKPQQARLGHSSSMGQLSRQGSSEEQRKVSPSV